METLLEDYKRRLKTVMETLSLGGNDITITRLGTKASCYRTFIAELEREVSINKSLDLIHTVIEIPISHEIIKDCYVYAPITAPEEFKSMLVGVFIEKLDNMIIENKPSHINIEDLFHRLSKVKIITDIS